jgi:L-ascorbate metabolism protein UlaG (beta-lactamase superfamily)
MNLDEAVRAVKRLRPKTALPMHYGLFAENTADPLPFIRECMSAGINSFEMQPGREFSI